MRIDSHMHVWSFEGVEYYDNKQLFTYMEELKLDRTALIAINNGENAKVKTLVEHYPNQFFGIAYVDRENQEASLRELECGVKAGYYKGIKVLSYQGGFHVDDPIQMRTYEKCLELDIPVLFHVGWHNAGSANPSAAANGANSCKYSCVGTPFEFANVLETFPELKVIFAHMGAENYFRCLGMAQRFHNVYMDTAWLEHYGSNQLPLISVKEWIEHACKYLGSEKIMFGGEYTMPWEIEQCDLSDKQKADLLGETCCRLYKL